LTNLTGIIGSNSTKPRFTEISDFEYNNFSKVSYAKSNKSENFKPTLSGSGSEAVRDLIRSRLSKK
jgi:hypothetical protein